MSEYKGKRMVDAVLLGEIPTWAYSQFQRLVEAQGEVNKAKAAYELAVMRLRMCETNLRDAIASKQTP